MKTLTYLFLGLWVFNQPVSVQGVEISDQSMSLELSCTILLRKYIAQLFWSRNWSQKKPSEHISELSTRHMVNFVNKEKKLKHVQILINLETDVQETKEI